MEEVLRELTEFELDAVAGGNPFAANAEAVTTAVATVVNSGNFFGLAVTGLEFEVGGSVTN